MEKTLKVWTLKYTTGLPVVIFQTMQISVVICMWLECVDLFTKNKGPFNLLYRLIGICRIGPIRFLTGWRKRRPEPGFSLVGFSFAYICSFSLIFV